MTGYLFDTNIIIYYFNGLTNDECVHAILAKSFNISIITKIEFLGWSRFAADQRLHDKARAFISNAKVSQLSEKVAGKTISLRQQYKTKTPDAIIAATALVHGLVVATNNANDFKRLGVDTISIAIKQKKE